MPPDPPLPPGPTFLSSLPFFVPLYVFFFSKESVCVCMLSTSRLTPVSICVCICRLAAKNGLIKDIYAMPGQHLFKGKKQ
jgi:hypothetical protein